VKIVETPFIKNKKQDQNTGSHANGKANDVDKRISFILPQIPPRGLEIVFEHVISFKLYVKSFLSRLTPDSCRDHDSRFSSVRDDLDYAILL
jgi:hypothetical protein